MPAIRLIVGLGNPGKQYALTRHNVGRWLLDAWHIAVAAPAWKTENQFFAQLSHVAHPDKTGHWLLKPATYMNMSGQAVSALVRFYKIPIDTILILHDELDFPAGVARFKYGGGHNGHNGLKSIITQLGDNHFWRLRLGIQSTHKQEDMKNYVLSIPSRMEKQQLNRAVSDVLAVLPLVFDNMDKAIQILHSHASERSNEIV